MKHVKLSAINRNIRDKLAEAGKHLPMVAPPIVLRITPPPYDFESAPGVKADRPMLQLGEGDSAEYFDSVEIDVHSISIVSDGGSAAEGFLQKSAKGDFLLLGSYPLPMFAAVTDDCGVSAYRLLPIRIPGILHTIIEIIQDPPNIRVPLHSAS